jgi:hypothetical protein
MQGLARVDRVAPACRFIDLRRCGSLSRAVFVNFELSENAIPSVIEVEDRHIEHEQRIGSLPKIGRAIHFFKMAHLSFSFSNPFNLP